MKKRNHWCLLNLIKWPFKQIKKSVNVLLTVNKHIFILNFLIYETFLQFYQHEVGCEWHLILITLLSYYNRQLAVSIQLLNHLQLDFVHVQVMFEDLLKSFQYSVFRPSIHLETNHFRIKVYIFKSIFSLPATAKADSKIVNTCPNCQ